MHPRTGDRKGWENVRKLRNQDKDTWVSDRRGKTILWELSDEKAMTHYFPQEKSPSNGQHERKKPHLLLPLCQVLLLSITLYHMEHLFAQFRSDVSLGLLISCTVPANSYSLEWGRSSTGRKKAKALCLQSLFSNSHTIIVLPTLLPLATNPKLRTKGLPWRVSFILARSNRSKPKNENTDALFWQRND